MNEYVTRTFLNTYEIKCSHACAHHNFRKWHKFVYQLSLVFAVYLLETSKKWLRDIFILCFHPTPNPNSIHRKRTNILVQRKDAHIYIQKDWSTCTSMHTFISQSCHVTWHVWLNPQTKPYKIRGIRIIGQRSFHFMTVFAFQSQLTAQLNKMV